jgi:hypothetical protein
LGVILGLNDGGANIVTVLIVQVVVEVSARKLSNVVYVPREVVVFDFIHKQSYEIIKARIKSV